MSHLEIRFEPHWINGGWLRRLTVPYAELDGEVHRCSWREPTVVQVDAGRHQLRTFVRYRRLLRGDGGSGTLTLDVPRGAGVRVVATGGLTNQSPFEPQVAV